jgi:hypothetical protein
VLIGGPDSDDTVGARHLELEVGVAKDRHEPGIAGTPKNGVVCPIESNHLESESLLSKVGGSTKIDRQVDPPTGSARFPGMTPWKPPTLGRRCVLMIPRRSRVWA